MRKHSVLWLLLLVSLTGFLVHANYMRERRMELALLTAREYGEGYIGTITDDFYCKRDEWWNYTVISKNYMVDVCCHWSGPCTVRDVTKRYYGQ